MRKIKILHLVNELGFDGTSKVVLNLCNIFNDGQHEISVVSLSPRIALVDSDEWPHNIDVYAFDYYYDSDYSFRNYVSLYLNRRTIHTWSRNIVQCIEKIKPDILQFHIQPRELLIAWQLNLPDTKFLFTDHLVRIKRGQYSVVRTWLLAWVYRKIYSRFYVVAVAESVFDCHKEYDLVSSKKSHVLIENRIDVLKFSPGVKSSLLIRVIYVARLERRKGQDVLLKAWSALETRENIELVLVGDGEIAAELRTQLNILQPKHPVIFTGSVTNVLPYLQSANIAVFPSFQEGLPLALLEKLSCGLPVIASNIDEFRKIIIDGKNGLLFKAGDSSDLLNKLHLLLSSPELREKLGNEAREFVVKNFSLRELKVQYDKTYQRLASKFKH